MNSVLDKFKIGKRIKVVKECSYRKGATGKISYPPSNPMLARDYGNNFFRKVTTDEGEKFYVWIVFDKTQFRKDNGLPVRQAEIMTENLEII